MGKLEKIDMVEGARLASQTPVQRAVNALPESILLTLSRAPAMTPGLLRLVEEKLGARMKYMAEREGQAPALAEQVLQGLQAGLTVREIAHCLDISPYKVEALAEREPLTTHGQNS